MRYLANPKLDYPRGNLTEKWDTSHFWKVFFQIWMLL